MPRLLTPLADAAVRMFFDTAHVTRITDHDADFRSIDLQGDALRGSTWHIGDKIQVRVDEGLLTLRTYTPTTWDPDTGSTSLLIHLGANGPGTRWARSLHVGDTCRFSGPRRSVRLDDPNTPIVLVGDETSFGLVAAWHADDTRPEPVAEIFEVHDVESARGVLAAYGVDSVTLFSSDDGEHSDAWAEAATAALRNHPDATVCITGRAQSIAIVRRAIKAAGLAGRTTHVKAYWDENRTGLD